MNTRRGVYLAYVYRGVLIWGMHADERAFTENYISDEQVALICAEMAFFLPCTANRSVYLLCGRVCGP